MHFPGFWGQDVGIERAPSLVSDQVAASLDDGIELLDQPILVKFVVRAGRSENRNRRHDDSANRVARFLIKLRLARREMQQPFLRRRESRGDALLNGSPPPRGVRRYPLIAWNSPLAEPPFLAPPCRRPLKNGLLSLIRC